MQVTDRHRKVVTLRRSEEEERHRLKAGLS